MRNTDEAARNAADTLHDNGDDGKVPERGPYGKLRNDVARDKRLTDAHLVVLAYRCTWADDKSDVRLDPATLYKVVRGRGLGRNVAERVVADLQKLQYLERHQPEPVNIGGKLYSEKAVDKLLPAAIPGDTDYRVVERSWFKGQFALEELAAFLLLRAGTGEGPRTYGRELKERFGWGRDVTAGTLRALSGLNMAAKTEPRETDGTFTGAYWRSGYREAGHRPRGFQQRGFRREGHIRKDSSMQDPLNEGPPPFGGSVAQARRAPEDDVHIVEPQIIEPAKGKARR